MATKSEESDTTVYDIEKIARKLREGVIESDIGKVEENFDKGIVDVEYTYGLLRKNLLFFAVKPVMVHYLLNKGVPLITDADGNSPVHTNAYDNNAGTIVVIAHHLEVRFGPEERVKRMNELNAQLEPPAWIAGWRGSLLSFNVLEESGADKNFRKSPEGPTAEGLLKQTLAVKTVTVPDQRRAALPSRR